MQDLHVNGELTLGENIADNVGIKLAYDAWSTQNPEAARNKRADKSGFTDGQKLFLSFAQGWCTKIREQDERRLIATDPHSPARYCVNGSLVNLPAFAETFGCETGAKMAPADRCSVW